jgi:hypothetical protein
MAPKFFTAIIVFGIYLGFCKKKLNDGDHGQATVSAKMGADSSAQNTPNIPKVIHPISPIAQKFGISLRKGFIGRP